MTNGKPAFSRFSAELAETLRAGGIDDPELEAQWILQDARDEAHAKEIAQRRANHEPLQYLLGKWEFYGLEMLVGAGVLIPRADTETLVETVLCRLRNKPSPAVADLCTGSGCIALALKSQRPDADVTGIEKHADAMKYADANAERLKLDVHFSAGDVLDAETAARFHGLDCIVCNPPYLTAADMASLQTEVTYEPETALAGGEDGLDFYRAITAVWKGSLGADGLLAYEVGVHQADAVAAILRENGFADVETVRDLNGIERVVLGRSACR